MTDLGSSSIPRPFNSAAAIIVFVCLECLVVVQAWIAWQDHFLTVSQMDQIGVHKGLPFIWHFAMWGDLLMVSGLAAYVVGRLSFDWDGRRVLVSFALGFAVATVLSWLYTFSGMSEAHVQNHRLTVVGVIHLFYMAIALATFVQFFFFSSTVSALLQRITSLFLFIHVFVGTHMALGILNLISPLNWYPAQPLKSGLGWLIVAAVGIGLLWRNIGTSKIVVYVKTTGHFSYDVAMWSMNQPSRLTSESYLRFISYMCGGLLGAIYFFKMAWSSWKIGTISMPVVLIGVLGIVYYLSMLSVKQELAIVQLVFPSDRIPDEFKLEDFFKITVQVTVFTTFYILLGVFAQRVMIASFFMLVIACIDWNTRRQINARIREYFSDAKYSPCETESNYGSIMASRSVISWFLFQLPHLRKEAARIAGCAVALGVAICAHLNHSSSWNRSAYVILIGTLVLNEIITVRWRWNRHKRLRIEIANPAVLTP
jgi:hypothetical protein